MLGNLYSRTAWATALACTMLLAASPARSAPARDTGCDAYAGSITTDSTQQCLVNGFATLVAQPGGDAVIPPGYQIGYVLTSTNGLTIEQVGPDPAFTVSGVNIWRIHSLVYDPSTLDFAAILDLDHAYQFQDMLVQDGICASFDISGAGTKTTECPNDCTADAGSISALNPDQCLVDGIAQLEALPDGNAVVPAGFSVAHVLTTGPDLLILAVGAEPSFSVQAEGSFAIHTLVYDPATLDLSGIVFGETSAFEIAALLQQGGGPICGSLDAAGAQFQVAVCNPVCEAFAGTLTAVAGEVCLVDGSADLDATPNGDAVVPAGYSIAYILARPNGIIENVEPITLFQWPLTGEYVIHTLVYDPFTLDPFGVQLGITNLSEINGTLLQGGGSVCGSLDLTGAPISVIDCGDPCNAFAGNDSSVTVCANDAAFNLLTLLGDGAWNGGTWSSPGGLPHSDLFVPGIDAPGAYVYSVGDIEPCPGDEAIVNVAVVAPPNAGADGAVTFCTDGPPVDLNGGDGNWYAPNGEQHPPLFSPGIDAAGVYTYVVAGSAPCVNDTSTLTVSLSIAPNAGTSTVLTVCENATPFSCLAELGGTPDQSGQWTGPNGAPFNGTFDPAIDLPGMYMYTVPGVPPCANAQATLLIVVQSCCDAGESAELTVCVTDAPFSMIEALGGEPCPGGSWTDPPNVPHGNFFIPGVDPAGIYTYSVPGAPGQPALTATLTVNVFECANPCIGATGEDVTVELCDNGSLYELFPLLSGSPVAGGSWFSTAFNEPFFDGFYDSMIDQGGVFGYVASGGPDCDPDTAYVTVVEFQCLGPCATSTPDAGIGGDIIRCTVDPVTELFDLLQGTPDVGGTWTGPDGNAFSGTFDPASDASGVYVYTVFDLLDCEPDTTQLNISVIECPQAHAQLVAWPNPSVDKVNIRFPAVLSAAATIEILDALGRSVRPSITIAGDLITVDVSAMPSGTYTLRAFDAGTSHTGRFARAKD